MSNPIDLNPQMVAQFGRGGTVNTSDTSPVTGVDLFAIYIHEDTEFASITEAQATGSIDLNWTKGEWIYGKITGYTLVSGKVRGYKA